MTDLHTSQLIEITQLRPHPKNYREHPEDQLKHIAASITEPGFYRNVVVAKDGTILAGHGVVEASATLGITEVPCVVVDIDPESPQAIKILTGDNTLNLFAMDNDRELADLLKMIKDEDELLGTGFDEEMLANLAMTTRPASELKDMDEAAERVGMPDYSPGEKAVLMSIRFDDEQAREDFCKLIKIEKIQMGTRAWSIRWPSQQRNDLSSVIFQEEGCDEDDVESEMQEEQNDG